MKKGDLVLCVDDEDLLTNEAIIKSGKIYKVWEHDDKTIRVEGVVNCGWYASRFIGLDKILTEQQIELLKEVIT